MMERGTEFKVLDHGYLRLIDFMGSDEGIVEAARMSTGRGFVSWDPYRRCKKCDFVAGYDPVNKTVMVSLDGVQRQSFEFAYCDASQTEHDYQDFPRGDFGMLDFMYRNKHMTPFEFGEVHVEVQAPIMAFREWQRHRTFAYSEFSARYSQMPNLHYVPDASRMQKQSNTNRQGSGEVVPDCEARDMMEGIREEQDAIYTHYEQLIDNGLAKEIARLNTPVSRYSKMRAKTDLRNWLGFLLLRTAPSAQWEIRQFALAMAEIVKSLFPKTYSLFEEYDRHGVHLSRSEATVIAANLFRDDAPALDPKLSARLWEIHENPNLRRLRLQRCP